MACLLLIINFCVFALFVFVCVLSNILCHVILIDIQYGYSHVQLDPKSKEWMMKAMKCDYPQLNKMAQENPALVRRRDMNVSHT